jgi:TRAP-type C4-dicarboxylate transport system permease large subunit
MTALRIALIVLFAMVTAGCEAIGNIFQAGIWVGAIMVVLVLAIVGFIASRFRRRS